ncbi:unnamed protein product [Dibothriocephalus latus]|uniref:Secreted protein n=1 Tax=Dibothriocephalus latus TaxID=60516 RepID=A0A3P6TBY2_DIBLA|nr:unnamed protein product [Dibothriocephalus latus]
MMHHLVCVLYLCVKALAECQPKFVLSAQKAKQKATFSDEEGRMSGALFPPSDSRIVVCLAFEQKMSSVRNRFELKLCRQKTFFSVEIGFSIVMRHLVCLLDLCGKVLAECQLKHVLSAQKATSSGEER